jgi:hypothetical protein
MTLLILKILSAEKVNIQNVCVMLPFTAGISRLARCSNLPSLAPTEIRGVWYAQWQGRLKNHTGEKG